MNRHAILFFQIVALAKYQFLLRYRNAMLGCLWAVGDQLLFLVVMSAVFSVLNRLPMGTYALYVFCGLVPWRFLDEAAQSGMESVVGGSWLLTQMPVHPLLFPVVRVCISLGDFLCAFFAGALIFCAIGFEPSLSMLVLPFSLLLWVCCALGLSCLFAAAFVFFRDIRSIIRSGMMLLFFSSPILSMAGNFPEGSFQRQFLEWHPLAPLLHLFQKPLFFKTVPSAYDWLAATLIAALCLTAGLAAIHSCRRKVYFYL